MFNPQLDKLTWRIVEKGITEIRPNYSGTTWTKTNMIDLKVGDIFRLTDPDGSRVKHEDGRDTFIAKSNGYINVLGIPEIEIA